ncbi:DUF5691 domain-containing protein [Nocardioides sp. CCNWLW239]|uniref:DUF5691 domain-containing protein n=1 Tax=Nocardioides sp. CCNWLW239 TaxID=3128902 RepID=UPI003015DBD1
MTTIEEWWDAVAATAVLGSARRGAPPAPETVPMPDRRGASAQTALLDAAALGGAMVRSGRPLRTGSAPAAAQTDRLPVAPAGGIQLLELVLNQTPGGADLRGDLLGHWLACANAAGYRVPHRLLPRLLDQALTRPELHRDALTAADARGAWLVANRRRWRPMIASAQAARASEASLDDAAWAHEPTAARAEMLTRLRAVNPAAARERLESVWASEKAADRATLIRTLRTGLSLEDEQFLERALDDRAADVRLSARHLLDALPASARGQRLAALLGPLISRTGIVRKTLHIEPPTEADAAATRDGLDKAPKGRSQRGHWLRQLAAGAPLEVWTDAAGRDPDATWAMITDPDARAGIISAVIARRDPAWARALVDDVHRGELLEIVPSADREAIVLRQILTGAGSGTGSDGATISARLGTVPGPWSLDFSRTILDLLSSRERELTRSVAILAARMPPEIVPDLHRLPDSLAKQRNQLIQHLSLVHAITEAFQ